MNALVWQVLDRSLSSPLRSVVWLLTLFRMNLKLTCLLADLQGETMYLNMDEPADAASSGFFGRVGRTFGF